MDRGIFSHVGGWIAYADKRGTSGIWAVDPEAPGDPDDQILLSPGTGWPIAWSRDGSRLLILRRNTEATTDLIVLNADGTETRLTNGDTWIIDGSFSPDGSKVVFATPVSSHEPARIYVVDASGGTPQVLLTAGLEGKHLPYLWLPTYSPDGSSIAYFEGIGGISRSLRVMNADGSGARIVRSDLYRLQHGSAPRAQVVGWLGNYQEQQSHMRNLVWSPDGTHLLFDGRAKGGGGIYTVGVDGSRLILVIPAGNPVLENEGYDMVAAGRQADWSPDLSRIAYTRANGLVITDADGTHVQEFGYAGSGPWNPLSEASSDIAPATSLGATFDTRLLWGAVLLALGATFVVIRRRKRQAAEP